MTTISPSTAPSAFPVATASAEPPLVLEELRSLTALRELQPAWERLLSRTPAATPFQSPDWLLPWAELFGAQGLIVLAAWRNGELVGLAPLRAHEGPDGTMLSFLGRGITDYSGFLVHPGDGAARIARAFWQRLYELRSSWTVCDLDAIPPSDPACTSPLPAGLRDQLVDDDVCPYVPLPGSVEELAQNLPHRMGLRSQRYLRRLHREGQLRFELADIDAVDARLDDFFRLHTARWEERRLPGVLADESIREFHRRVAHGMCARGRLRLHAVHLNDRVVAVVYGFVHGCRFYSYLSGFDPDLSSLSVGTVSIFHAMSCAIAEGCEAFDFLRGSEPYKYRWGAVNRSNRRRTVRVEDGRE